MLVLYFTTHDQSLIFLGNINTSGLFSPVTLRMEIHVDVHALQINLK